MEPWCLRQFGGITCELGVAPATDAAFVAWALLIATDGRRSPLFDREGRLLLRRAATAEEAITSVRHQVTMVLGPEQT